MTRYVFSTAETIRYRYPTHVNDLVLDRVEATTTEVFVVVLEPGEAPPLHRTLRPTTNDSVTDARAIASGCRHPASATRRWDRRAS